MHPLLDGVDLDAAGDQAVELLRSLIRFDTSNPPGNEAPCAEFVAQQLRAAGMQPQLFVSQPGRANVVARLVADEATRTGGPVLLNAHLDVVAADGTRWTHPPFDAVVADGFVWGRGAIDMKNMAAMSVKVMQLLARSGAKLRRDVIFCGVADEEAGCAWGSEWMVNNHPDLVRAEYAIGEVGGFTLDVRGKRVYPVQVAEKGIVWLRVRATGPTGHGSLPRPDNAVVVLAKFLAKVGSTRLPLHVSEPVRGLINGLAGTQDGIAEQIMKLMLIPGLSPVAVDRLVSEPSTRRSLQALLRNTATPTVLRAGGKTNVIPAVAEAELDGRIAVGSSAEELLSELRALAGPAISFEVLSSHPPTVASPDTALFSTIADVVAEHEPGATAIPNVLPGFTDASRWSRLGATCYGFSPIRFAPGSGVRFADLFHGDDERVPVEGFKAGLYMLADAVFRFAVAA